MTSPRRWTAVLALAALAVLVASMLASCAKNELYGEGLELWIGVKGVGPQGLGAGGTGCPVNTIDSVLFVQEVDSTVTLAATSFVVTDSLGNPFPGSVRFVSSNRYISYFQPFPSTNVYYVDGTAGVTPNSCGKVYFVPAHPFSGHKTYTYTLTTGVRMRTGQLVRDAQSWSFTTGDSVAPPAPAQRAS